MEIVAIRDMSAGNDSVGEMWQETKIFDDSQPISDVMQWAIDEQDIQLGYSRKKITLTIPHK